MESRTRRVLALWIRLGRRQRRGRGRERGGGRGLTWLSWMGGVGVGGVGVFVELGCRRGRMARVVGILHVGDIGLRWMALNNGWMLP